MSNIRYEAYNLLDQFADSIKNIEIDSSFDSVVDIILNCEGKIITTGMGKAGIAMKKFSSLLCSLSFPSAYLHPGESSHGDLGLLSKQDILFVASTSGKTREVLEIIELSKEIGPEYIVGITSHKDSPIRDKVDYIIDMGEIQEAGHLGLAPTTSILVMLALTDCLALCAAKEKGLSLEEYSLRHHSGYVGSVARKDDKIF